MKRNKTNLKKYKAFVLQVWTDRGMLSGGRCEDCSDPIGNWVDGQCYPKYHNVAHGERGRRQEKDCLDPDNITFKCFKCHSNNDHKQSVQNSNWLDRW